MKNTPERQKGNASMPGAGQGNTIDLLQRQARSLQRILQVARAIADSRVA